MNKGQILKLFLWVVFPLLFAQGSYAAICGCDAPPECGPRPPCGIDALELLYERPFCKEGLPTQGLVIHKSGRVSFFDHFAGVLDPSLYYRIARRPWSNEFTINTYKTSTDLLVYEGNVNYRYNEPSDILYADGTLLEENNCE